MSRATSPVTPAVPSRPGTSLLLLLPLVFTALCGCAPMQRISEGAYRNATATGAGMELERLGYRVNGRLACTLPRGNTQAVVRVTCAGHTVHGQPVGVAGLARDADTKNPREQYVITVAGREVLRKSCLGLGCGKITPRRGQFAGNSPATMSDDQR